jgi:type IV secretory pathway protease TraF
MMKIIIAATAGVFALLSVAEAADLPRKEPPPTVSAPIGKYPVGKYPVGKYPVGKYPQPVVTKG